MLRYLTAGESHGQALVVIVEGLPAGLEVTAEQIQTELARRRLGGGTLDHGAGTQGCWKVASCGDQDRGMQKVCENRSKVGDSGHQKQLSLGMPHYVS